MKSALALLFLAVTACAQDQAAITAAQAACGPKDVQFDVKIEPAQRAASHDDADKATVFVIGDDVGIAHPTIRVGIDGSWAGATQRHSYFSFSVEPGEHHLCASGSLTKDSPDTALAHLTAEAGKTYYFRTRVTTVQIRDFLSLEPIDSDQGKNLVALYPLGTAHQKNK
jgi:hypothetical protein